MVQRILILISLALPQLAVAQIPDSLQTSMSDTLATIAAEIDSLEIKAGQDGALSRGPVRVELAPWARPAPEWRGPPAQDLSHALRDHEDIQLREMGDPGSRAFLSVYPQGGPAPEFYVDGVPSRSPGDVEPSIYDRSWTPLRTLRVARGTDLIGGPPAVVAELEAPDDGQSRLASHFTRTTGETFFRGISFRTPRAARTLFFDFEEWKAEDGYASFTDPAFVRPADFGRAKMRRFEVGGQSVSKAGLLSLRFGRGRRYYDGHILGTQPLPNSTERWTGQVVLGLDRGDSTSHARTRFYHLDWQDMDAAHGDQLRDASRTGFSVSRSATTRGFGWRGEVERWSASYTDPLGQTRRPERVYSGRVGLSHRSGDRFSRVGFVEAAGMERLEEVLDFGGGAHVAMRTQLGEFGVRAERQLRFPTLAETGGSWLTDFADGTERTLLGADDLSIERHDRVRIRWSARLAAADVELMAEQWWLSRGVGWEVVDASTARYRADVRTDHRQLGTSARRSFGTRALGWRVFVAGFYALDDLQAVAGRGTGWPKWRAEGRVAIWTRFFHDNNTLRLDYSLNSLGERLDDLVSPLPSAAGIDTNLPTESRHDLRLSLRIREAELYFAWDNVLDATITEVFGGRDRGRQRRLGLYWRFYN